MSKINHEIVHEGWLTKSPPTKRIWRAKWRRRWFALRQSGDLPGQYFLDYYSDRNCRRLKGTIDLDLCEQVDAGLHMERSSSSALGPKLRGSVFSVRTQARTYHLEADCEADMERWVDAICRVCGLRASEDSNSEVGTFQSNARNSPVLTQPRASPDSAGPYISISECITGARMNHDPAQPKAFTFDTKNIVMSSRGINNNKKTSEKGSHVYISPAAARHIADESENDSILSEDECKSLSASQSCIGPAVPPRPPKTFRLVKDGTFREKTHGPRLQESIELKRIYQTKDTSPGRAQWSRAGGQRCYSNASSLPARSVAPQSRYTDDDEESHALYSPGRSQWSRAGGQRCYSNASSLPARAVHPHLHFTDEEDDTPHFNHPSLQYYNLTMMPPAVNRALKPRHPVQCVAQVHREVNDSAGIYGNGYRRSPNTNYRGEYGNSGFLVSAKPRAMEEMKSNALQYLDLDHHTSRPAASKPRQIPRRNAGIMHNKSHSSTESDSAYKTVDFLKTEAFNITRQDAEASRSNAMAH